MIRYSAGNEHNPMDDLGRTELTIEPDGTAVLEHHRIGHRDTYTGHVELGDLYAALERAGFPRPGLRPILPDTRLKTLIVGEEWVRLGADDLCGYDEVFAILDGFVDRLRAS